MDSEDKLANLETVVKNINATVEDIAEIIESREKQTRKNEKHGYVITQRINLSDATVSVREYNSSYVGDVGLATDIYHAQKLGMKLRQLEVQLRGGTVAFESGQFSDALGNVRMGKLSLNPVDLVRGVIRKINDETFFRPTLTGTGTVTFNSSFKFITLFPLPQKTRLVLEKGIYLASIGDFEFKTTRNLNAGYVIFGDKSVLQTDIRGKGVVVLELPVRLEELEEHEVTEDSPYMVNGDYVLMWSGNLKRTVKPAGSLFGSLASATGIVEEYSGTGKVWTAPTLGYYMALVDNMKTEQPVETKDELLDNDRGKQPKTFLQKLFNR